MGSSLYDKKDGRSKNHVGVASIAAFTGPLTHDRVNVIL